MSRLVLVMQGVSGSGKSTISRMFSQKFVETYGPGACEVVSADDYFRRDGEYKFDQSKLGAAHNECFRKFMRLLTGPNSIRCLIVDNTNCSAAECAPYMQAASAFGWEPQVCRVVADWTMAAQRNGGRAPASSVMQQAINLASQTFPAHWKIVTVSNDAA
jgi:predicted ABC-type ATPase